MQILCPVEIYTNANIIHRMRSKQPEVPSKGVNQNALLRLLYPPIISLRAVRHGHVLKRFPYVHVSATIKHHRGGAERDMRAATAVVLVVGERWRARHHRVRGQEVPEIKGLQVARDGRVAVQGRQAREVQVAQAVRRRPRREVVSFGQELVQRRREGGAKLGHAAEHPVVDREVRVQVLMIVVAAVMPSGGPGRLGGSLIRGEQRMPWGLGDRTH